MGLKAEKVYGRKNFLELYAVFSSPVLYRVSTQAGRDIGSLEQDFVDRLVEEMSSFLLGGRAWTVERVSHEDRVVVVREAPAGLPSGALRAGGDRELPARRRGGREVVGAGHTMTMPLTPEPLGLSAHGCELRLGSSIPGRRSTA